MEVHIFQRLFFSYKNINFFPPNDIFYNNEAEEPSVT